MFISQIIYGQKIIFLCKKQSILPSPYLPNSPNLPKQHRIHQACQICKYQILPYPTCQTCTHASLLYNKRACPTKNEPQQGISYLEREGEIEKRVREREGGGRVSRQAYLRFSQVQERQRGETEIQRDRETQKQRAELTIEIPSKAGQPNQYLIFFKILT